MLWRSDRADPALERFSTSEAGGVRMLVKPGYEEWVELVLRGDGAFRGRRTVGGGRAPHPLVALPEGGWAVLRRYRRGGLMRHLNRETYFVGHRALEEVRATERARLAGVRVPEVLAAVERRRGVGYGALLATRWIAGSVGLDRWLAEQSAESTLVALRLSGKQIGLMHGGGVAHPDLNLRNLLVVPGPVGAEPIIHLIDFDRAEVGDRPVAMGRRERDLKRLGRSARKLGATLSRDGWHAMREGYGAGWPRDLSLG